MGKNLTVADVMSREVVTVDANGSVRDAVALMDRKNYGALVVTENGKPIGIFTERDCVKRVLSKGLDPVKAPIRDAMTPKLVCAHPTDEFKEAARTMYLGNIRHLPVKDGGKLVGMLSIRDTLRILGNF